jgi:hypothetical protein
VKQAKLKKSISRLKKSSFLMGEYLLTVVNPHFPDSTPIRRKPLVPLKEQFN